MLHRSHPFFPDFERLMAEAAASPPTYDLGTSARFAKEVGLVRHLFQDRAYLACGYRPDMSRGEDACDLDCDIQNMSNIESGAAGSVICLSVLEHVVDPRRAVEEICRILRPGGVAIVSVPFWYPFHGKSDPLKNPVFDRTRGLAIDSSHEAYGDFWRFTHQGLALLFGRAGFARVDVYPVDGHLISRLHLLGLYQLILRIPGAEPILKKLDRVRLGRTTTMHFVCARKSPPLPE